MKKATHILIGILAGMFIFGIFFLARSFQTSAAKNSVLQLEYCAITNIYTANGSENQVVLNGGANICYLQISGCQNEEVRSELIYAKFLQDYRLENTEYSKSLAYNRAQDLALAKAIAKLGAEGWEMVNSPALEFDNYIQNNQGTYAIAQGAKNGKQDVYFKRLKP